MAEKPKRALAITADPEERAWVIPVLEEYGYTNDLASNGYSGLNYASYEKYALVLMTSVMPLLKVKNLFPKIRKLQPKAKLAILDSAQEYEWVGKGTPPETVHHADSLRLYLEDLEMASEPVSKRAHTESEGIRIVGNSPRMSEYFNTLNKIQKSSVTILIYGGSGTGKELTARSIHYGGPRRKHRFVTVNSAAIPESLLESELFGHEKGAFTGAHERRIGRFELAHQGTLFLDEVAELAPSIQAKFLRVLEEQAFERVGGNETIRVDVRIISATNRNLQQMVKEVTFREDLYYRLNAIPIRVPYLHERKEDIPLLIAYFLDKYLPVTGKRQPFTITENAMAAMTEYPWPGNVRELENAVMRLMVLCDGPVIDVSELPPEIVKGSLSYHPENADDKLLNRVGSMQEIEREAIAMALESCNFNASRAARLLNIGRMTFYRKAKQYAIKLRE